MSFSGMFYSLRGIKLCFPHTKFSLLQIWWHHKKCWKWSPLPLVSKQHWAKRFWMFSEYSCHYESVQLRKFLFGQDQWIGLTKLIWFCNGIMQPVHNFIQISQWWILYKGNKENSIFFRCLESTFPFITNRVYI